MRLSVQFVVAVYWVSLILFFSSLEALSAVVPVHLGEWPGYNRGDPKAVRIVGDRAYVAGLLQGLEVMDISDPAKPTHIGGWDVPRGIWVSDVKVSGDLAFLLRTLDELSLGRLGIDIIDTRDPKNLLRVGGINAVGGMEAVGNRFYLASGSLRIFDVTQPANPMQLSEVNTGGGAYRVTVAGNLAFVADSNTGVRIIDVSDATSPKSVGSYNTGGWVAAVAGNLAYVTEGLKVLDISDPANPRLVGGYITNAVYGLAVGGNFAYQARGDDGLEVVDMSNLSEPMSKGTYATNWPTTDVVLDRNLAFLVKGTAGVEILDVTNPEGPTFIGRDENAGVPFDVAIENHFAYIADHMGGMQIIDVSNPARPVRVGGYRDVRFPMKIASVGNLVFLNDVEQGLIIMDVSDPAKPVRVGSFITGGPAAFTCIVARDTTVYFGGLYGLQVFDVRNPAVPTVLSTLGLYLNSIALQGNILFATDNVSLRIFDVSDPRSLVELGECAIRSGPYGGVAVDGDLIVTAGPGRLQCINAGNRAKPIVIGECEVAPNARGVSLIGTLAFVAGYERGLQVVDVSDPSRPFVAAEYDTGGYAQASTAADGLAYVTDLRGGMHIFKVEGVPVLQMAKPTDVPRLSITGEIGKQYQIEYLPMLGGTNWSAVQTITVTTNVPVTLEDVSFGDRQGFYRARSAP